jgi:hypothetical protein
MMLGSIRQGLREKVCYERKIPKNVLQGLKPIDFIAFIGTTEVVPFQSEQTPFPGSSFSAACKARSYSEPLMYGLKPVPFNESSFPQHVKACSFRLPGDL